MSAEANLRFKLNKKLKIAVGNSKFSNNGKKKGESTLNESEKGSFKSNIKGKKFHTAEEGTQGVLDRKEKFKSVNSDRGRKRIYADQEPAREGRSYNNAEAPYRKALSRKGQNQVKDGYVNENSDRRRKRSYADQDPAWEGRSYSNAEAPYRKALSRKGRNQVKDGSIKENSDRRRKRSYADQDPAREGRSYSNAEAPYRKALSMKGQNQVKDGSVNEKYDNRSPWRPRSTWGPNALENTASETKRFSPTVRSAKVYNKTKGKEVEKMESVRLDSVRTGTLKKHNKLKPDLSKSLDSSHEKSSNISCSKFSKKKVRDKKTEEESEVIDAQPKKRKRIRLDPHDISNKRHDDTIVVNESTKEKEKDVEEKSEISKNAQFRAIQPSPSILSYVEDNLLGRRRLIELRRAGYNTELSARLDNIPFSTSSERERIEENVFRNNLTFVAAAKVSSSFPPPNLPEIAFAGRSNVGKSSLLNALTRQWGVVRTSDKPGLTQTINFFNLGSKLCMVDLPGYGFAYAKEEVKDAWEQLVKEYVSTRVGLKRVCLLVDTKWGMKPRDHELIDLMERAQTKYQILLTKTDTVFPIDVARRAMQIEESLKANKSLVQPVMMMSSRSGAGIRSLRTVLAKIARVAK